MVYMRLERILQLGIHEYKDLEGLFRYVCLNCHVDSCEFRRTGDCP